MGRRAAIRRCPSKARRYRHAAHCRHRHRWQDTGNRNDARRLVRVSRNQSIQRSGIVLSRIRLLDPAPGTEAQENILSVLLQAFDIRKADESFRSLSGLSPEQAAAGFEQLRTSGPLRPEFRHFAVDLNQRHIDLIGTYAALGFQVQEANFCPRRTEVDVTDGNYSAALIGMAISYSDHRRFCFCAVMHLGHRAIPHARPETPQNRSNPGLPSRCSNLFTGWRKTRGKICAAAAFRTTLNSRSFSPCRP